MSAPNYIIFNFIKFFFIFSFIIRNKSIRSNISQ